MKIFKELIVISLCVLFLCDIYGCSVKIDKKEIVTSHQKIENSDTVYIGSHPRVILLQYSDNYNFQKDFEREVGKQLNEIGVLNESQYWIDNQVSFEGRSNFFQDNYSVGLLREYPTNKRFILFSELDVCDINLHTDTGSFGTVLAGAFLTGTIIGSPLGIPMMIGGGLPRTEVSVSFKYDLLIYDRKLNAIVWKDKVDVTESDRVNGSMKDGDKSDILRYYNSLINNAFIVSSQKGIKFVSK